MESTTSKQPDVTDAREVPTPDELVELCKVEVYDRVGTKTALGDLIKGKRSILVFTRHFCV